MGAFKDLTGMQFGRLTVIRRATKEECNETKSKEVRWVCECNCKEENKNVVIVPSSRLNSGETKSCGCYRKEHTAKFNKETKTIHGDRNTRLYAEWAKMKFRCNDKDNKDYGGRGISVCEKWNAPDGYPAFKEWAINNGYCDNLSIDRIDNDGNYEPSNCRWVDAQVQANNKRTNRIVKFEGESYTVSQLSRKFNINKGTLLGRLNNGMTGEEMVNTPIKSTSRMEEYNGNTLSLTEWSNILGISVENIYYRLSKGYTVKEALTTKTEKVPINGVYFVDNNNKPYNETDWMASHDFD